MRRLAVVLLVLSVHGASVTGARPQDRPLQADPVVQLLADLESALSSGRADDFRALASPSLPAEDAERIRTAIGSEPSQATVRERARRPLSGSVDVVVDVLLTRGRTGRVATWRLSVVAVPGRTDRLALAGVSELATIDGLFKLALDPARQFSIHNLTIDVPDLKLSMSSGAAFVAESANGVTALVLRGDGSVNFAPPDPAEQGQLQLFARQSVLSTEIESAFIRLNPAEYASLVSAESLVADEVDRRDLERAQEIFEEYAPRTYNLDLSALTAERWSLEPSAGSIVIEFRSRRHGWLTYARSPNEPEDITLFERSRSRNICIYPSAEKLRQRGRFYDEDTDEAFDVLHYTLDLTFDPVRSWVSGRGALRVKVKSRLSSSLTFKLAQPLTVSSVSSPRLGDLLALRIIGQNNVIVSLPRLIEAGTEIDLEIAYSGRLPPQPLDREAIAPQGQLGRQEVPEILLLPEPRYLYSNRVHWYPQAPVSDYATAALTLRVPSEFQVVASGTFRGASVATTSPDGSPASRSMRTVSYSADRPVRYLSCLITRLVPTGRIEVEVPAIAPPEDGASDGADTSLTLEVVATPRTTSRARQLASRAEAILGFYARTLGEAPYPAFTLAAVDDNLPGGHSPAFFAMLHQPLPTTPFSWSSDPVAFDAEYGPFFLAHEIAHQWWGQAVGWKNYHEQWLSEGLAQYFAVLYAESDRGQDMLASLVGQMRDSSVPLVQQGPIYLGYRLGHIKGEGAVFRGIVYNKSAVVLHMLRRLIGDEAFFAGLRQFYKDWRFHKAGTDDLRATFEAHTPLRLARFFDRWVMGATLPRLRVSTGPGAAGTPAVVVVEQIGDVFDLPLTVQVQYADGQEEDIDLVVTEARVEHPVTRTAPVRRVQVRDELTPAVIVR